MQKFGIQSLLFIKIGAIEDEKFADLVNNSIIFETIFKFRERRN